MKNLVYTSKTRVFEKIQDITNVVEIEEKNKTFKYSINGKQLATGFGAASKTLEVCIVKEKEVYYDNQVKVKVLEVGYRLMITTRGINSRDALTILEANTLEALRKTYREEILIR